jgi:hypothetical protein
MNFNNKDYINTFLLNITLENFNEIATLIHRFKNTGFYKHDEFPWSVNINDLKTIADFIEFPSQFIHYIYRRLKINNRSKSLTEIYTSDELDFFGTYFDNNLYYDDTKDYSIIMLNDYSMYFNEYYFKQGSNETLHKIHQKFDPIHRSIFNSLEEFKNKGYTYIILRLLEFSSDTRKQITQIIKTLIEKTLRDNEIHDATLIVLANENDKSSGLGITFISGLYTNAVEIRDKVEIFTKYKKYQQKAYERITFPVFIKENMWLINEFCFSQGIEEFSKKDDAIVKEVFKKPMTMVRKIYPNELCPCGSGKKYKYCHGRN